MRLRFPGPMDLLEPVRELASAATALSRAATGAVALVPRFADALDRVEVLLDRVEAAVGRIELLAGDSEGAVRRVDGILAGADAAVTRVDGILDGAEGAVGRVDVALGRADSAVQRTHDLLAGAGGLVDRSDHLLSQAHGPLTELLPVLQRLADTVEAHEVEAAVLLIDRLPALLQAVDEDVLPLTRALRDVGPELHELLRLVEDLHRMVEALPGVKLLRRRGSES